MAKKSMVTVLKKKVAVKKKKSFPVKKKQKAVSYVYSRAYSEEELALIKERAYYIWEREGRPDDSDSANWLEAEAELKAEGLI